MQSEGEGPAGIAAVIFVASAADFSLSDELDDSSSAVLRAWESVHTAASLAHLASSVLLSKCDLLGLSSGSGGGALAEANVLARFSGAPGQAVNLLDGSSTRAAFLDLMRVPLQLSENDDAAALEEGCYLGLALFAPCQTGDAGDRVLLQHQAIPHVLIQKEPLNLEDQLWLQQLPQPIPNLMRATPEEAARLGKGSTGGIAVNFWIGLCSLSRMLGHAEPENFGILHPVPLLMPPGAAMLVLCRKFDNVDPKFVGAPRSLRWRGVDNAAIGMAAAMPGCELRNFSRDRKRSYSTDIDAQRKLGASDLHPRVWMATLNEVNKTQTKLLDPGTYVSALYLCSSAQGLQVLLSSSDPSVLPSVKVSNKVCDGAAWSQLLELASQLVRGEFTRIPDEWATAKAWLGPDVTPESAFSDLQKMFYGVVALRQTLGRRCTPMKDELRYSQRVHARDSLAALGTLLPIEEAIIMDEALSTRAIVITNFYSMECTDSFPDGMHWYPLELFEARNSVRLLPSCFEKYICAKRGLVDRKRMSTIDRLRSSGDSQCSQAPSADSDDKLPPSAPPDLLTGVVINEPNWDERLERAWDRMRWIKDATLWATSADRTRNVAMPSDLSAPSTAMADVQYRPSATRKTSLLSHHRGSVTGGKSRRRSSVGSAAATDNEQRLRAAKLELDQIRDALASK